jgi:hypothetical protein
MLPALFVAMLLAPSRASAWAPDPDVEASDEPDGSAWAPAPEAAAPPEGIYLVSETYVDDVVSRDGPVTIYATETVPEITGSYARILESLPTGARSGYDGAAFNGRAALTDGRAVAGTYYENFVRTDNGFVAVSIVFFQDDLEIARAADGMAPVLPPPAERAPAVETPAGPAPSTPLVGWVAPRIENEPSVRDPDPVGPGRGTPWPPLPDVTLEVLRARRVAIPLSYPGAVAWRFVSGEGTALGALSGGIADPFVARWDRLAPVGGAWVDRFQLDFADGTMRELAVRIAVRAPGLVE